MAFDRLIDSVEFDDSKWNTAEAGGYPVEPQEESADHGEQVGVVSGALLARLDLAASQHFGHRQAEVGAEHVHINRLANIICLDCFE